MQSLLIRAAIVFAIAGGMGAASGPLGPDTGVLDRATIYSPVALERVAPMRSADGRRFLLWVLPGGSQAMRAHFKNVRLPAESSLFIYGFADGRVTDQYGPFTGSGPVASGSFWSLPVHGRMYVELQLGREVPVLLPFEIDRIANPAVPAVDTRATLDVTDVELFEGDILVEPDTRQGRFGSRRKIASIGLIGDQYRWPNGVLPYEIEGWVPDAYRITNAVDHWNTLLDGVVRMVRHSDEPNYLVFRRSTDPGRCASWVGMVGNGPQVIDIGDYCATGNMIHEIGHAFGLWHEQSREDRNAHVKIAWNNIVSGLEMNFLQMIDTGDDLGEYDFGSIMHYNAYAFSANGMPTIETIPAGIPIGQRDHLSRGDVEGIKALYPVRPAAATTPQPQPGVVVTICSNPDGVQLTVDGTEVEGPLTTEWSEGSQHTIAAPESVMAAGARSRFAGWSDGGDLAHDVITPSAAAVYTATYARSYELRAIAADAGRGAVVVEPQSRDGFYAENATVTLTATAQPGYCFAGWTGLIGGTPAQASFSLTGPLEIAATFEAGSYSLTSALDYATVNGGEFRIGVEANDGCVWKAETSEPWISITSADTTSGSGVVEVSLSENGSRRTRVGRVHIGATEWTVVQLAR